MRPDLGGLRNAGVLGALAVLVLARLDPLLDPQPALLLLAVGALYGAGVGVLLAWTRGLPGPRPLWGALVGPLPFVLLLPVSATVPGLETVAEARLSWVVGTVLLGLGLACTAKERGGSSS